MIDLIQISRHHFRAIMEKRVDEIIDRYSNSSNLLVFVEGPRWATLGFENVARGWRAFVDSPIQMIECDWVENLQSQTTAEMGFVAGIVELKVDIRGQIRTIRFRGTFILQKESDGEWRIIQEHFSQPAVDPYGIGDWVKQ